MFEKIEKKHFISTTSTMDFIKEVKTPLSPNTLYRISADTQTKGRGQYSRCFVDIEKKSLLCTYLFALDKELPPSPLFIEVAALTLARLLKSLNLFPMIKWPNDLLVGGKKIAGLLAEITEKDGQQWCSLGVGLNIALNREEVAAINETTTSVLLETKQEHDVSFLQGKLDEQIHIALSRFVTQGFEPFYVPFNTFFLFTDQPVALLYQNKLLEGSCLGFDPEGLMLLKDHTDTLHSLNPAFIDKISGLPNH